MASIQYYREEAEAFAREEKENQKDRRRERDQEAGCLKNDESDGANSKWADYGRLKGPY